MDYDSLTPEELVRECAKAGSPEEAWQAFVRRFDPVISVTVYRVVSLCDMPSRANVQDRKQDLYFKLCTPGSPLLAMMAAATGDGCFKVLKAGTANLVLDHYKASRALKRGSGKIEQELDAVAAAGDVGSEREMNLTILRREIDEALQFLGYDDLQRSVYWRYFYGGLPAASIAGEAALNMGEKGVESLLKRMNDQVKKWLASKGKGKSD